MCWWRYPLPLYIEWGVQDSNLRPSDWLKLGRLSKQAAFVCLEFIFPHMLGIYLIINDVSIFLAPSQNKYHHMLI
jgi:hypothetical protein